MAHFDPPHNHWDENFDARLTGSLVHLKDLCEVLAQRDRQRQQEIEALRADMEQAVKDMRFWAERRSGK